MKELNINECSDKIKELISQTKASVKPHSLKIHIEKSLLNIDSK